jgi:hypothetical protein
VVVTTLIALVRSVEKRVAPIVLNVSAQYVTDEGENIIRTVFALNAAGWGSQSQESPLPKFHY